MRKDPSGWFTRISDRLIAEFEGAGDWQNRTLADWAYNQICERPTSTAIVEGTIQKSFLDLWEDASQLASAFKARGLSCGDVISFQLPNWHEAVTLNLAASMSGVVCNPIVPIYRDAELRYILRDCRTRILFIPGRFRSVDYAEMAERLAFDLPDLQEIVVIRGGRTNHTSFDDFVSTRSPTHERWTSGRVDPNSVKLVMYTSGTTGHAKGVLHTHNTIGSELAAICDRFRLSSSDCVLMPSPITHITGYLFALELPFICGCNAILMDRWNASESIGLINTRRVTLSVGATPFLVEILDEAKRIGTALPSLSRFICGGAPVPPEIITRANKTLDGLAFRCYGSTETPTVTLGITDRVHGELGAVTDGQIVNNDVMIVDPLSGQEVAEGVEGEILVRGPEVMVGYTHSRDTEDAFNDSGYFLTGDLGRISHECFLTISGRKKDLIIRGGENISAKEIEDALQRHPSVRDVAIVAMPHARLGEAVCAFVVLEPGASLALADMAKYLDSERLARQKIPEWLEIIEQLPRTAAGKVQKNLLRDRVKSCVTPLVRA